MTISEQDRRDLAESVLEIVIATIVEQTDTYSAVTSILQSQGVIETLTEEDVQQVVDLVDGASVRIQVNLPEEEA